MLSLVIGVTLLTVGGGGLAWFLAAELVPSLLSAWADGEGLMVAAQSGIAMAMVVIGVAAFVQAPTRLLGTVQTELHHLGVGVATPDPEEQLRQQMRRSPEPMTGVKVARVVWRSPLQPPVFLGASGGTSYEREDVARCARGRRGGEGLCYDQQTHRCGFYAMPTRDDLHLEATGTRAAADPDWPQALERFGQQAHVVTVALHGEVMCYDRPLRGQRQTVTSIDVAHTCARLECGGPLEAVAAREGRLVGLCAPHAALPGVASHALSLAEFAVRHHIEIRPTTADGRPTPRRDVGGRRPAPGAAAAAVHDVDPTDDVPLQAADERVDGWTAGIFDLDRGRLVTGTHQLEPQARTPEPLTAARRPAPPSPGHALAHLRLGGEVVVGPTAVASRDVHLWQLHLPGGCQAPGCDRRAELVDSEGPAAVSRCPVHAGPAARTPQERGAEHGVAMTLSR